MGKDEMKTALQAIQEIIELKTSVGEFEKKIEQNESELRMLLDQLHDKLTEWLGEINGKIETVKEDCEANIDRSAVELKSFVGDMQTRYEQRLDGLRERIDAQQVCIDELRSRMGNIENRLESFQSAISSTLKKELNSIKGGK